RRRPGNIRRQGTLSGLRCRRRQQSSLYPGRSTARAVLRGEAAPRRRPDEFQQPGLVMSDWLPVLVLPNLDVREPIGTENIQFVRAVDPRVNEVVTEEP